MDAASATKVLVCGDVRGHLDACFARVTTVNANHGPFACLLCVGDFLGPLAGAPALLAPFRSGERTPPLPTYFIGPPGGGLPSELLASSDAGGEVAPRMTCLGAAGIHVLSGLKVAFISGAQTDAEQQRPKFMQPARLAAKEEYEHDPARLHGARMAAGYRLDLWTYRYRQEAFDPGALIFGAS